MPWWGWLLLGIPVGGILMYFGLWLWLAWEFLGMGGKR